MTEVETIETEATDPILQKIQEVFGEGDQASAGSGLDEAAQGADEVKEDDAAAPDAPATGDAAPEPTFTPRQLNAAQRFGLSGDDLAALGDKGAELAERLAKAHSDIGRRYSEIGRAQQRLANQPPAEDAPASGDAETADEAASAEAAAIDQAGPLKHELDILRRQVGELVRQVQQGHQRQLEATADHFFASLDAEVYPQFGRGSAAELAADSPQRVSRRQLVGKAQEIAHGYELVHGEPMDFQQSLRQALAILAADAPLAAQRRRLAAEISQRSDQRLARPTQRATGRQFDSPLERTRSALEEWEKTRGVRFFND